MSNKPDQVSVHYISPILEKNNISMLELIKSLANGHLIGFVIKNDFHKQGSKSFQDRVQADVNSNFFARVEIEQEHSIGKDVGDRSFSFHIPDTMLFNQTLIKSIEISREEYDRLIEKSKKLSLNSLYLDKRKFDSWVKHRLTLLNNSDFTNSEQTRQSMEIAAFRVYAKLLEAVVEGKLEKRPLRGENVSRQMLYGQMTEFVANMTDLELEKAGIEILRGKEAEGFKYLLGGYFKRDLPSPVSKVF